MGTSSQIHFLERWEGNINPIVLLTRMTQLGWPRKKKCRAGLFNDPWEKPVIKTRKCLLDFLFPIKEVGRRSVRKVRKSSIGYYEAHYATRLNNGRWFSRQKNKHKDVPNPGFIVSRLHYRNKASSISLRRYYRYEKTYQTFFRGK